MKKSWTEINLNVIRNNYLIYKDAVPESATIMAVVKADAYGHGDDKIVKTLQDIGVHDFAVSNIREAIRLRKNGIKGQILVLGYTPIDQCKNLIDFDITQAIISEEYYRSIRMPIKCQFTVDTGMNRIGLDANDVENCKAIIYEVVERLNVTGVFTHLCVADTAEGIGFTEVQINKFKIIVNAIKSLELPYVHCLNSAGGLWHECYGDLVRLGIVLYGLNRIITMCSQRE